ncbi:hypothetical protein BDQ12DRAFT_730902 [Crucibulum laeve]|uniref:C3H1-type domain-containing protein n=1 Tax=Crucibulum laeve TaxID=68775 RepID=A0A5C3MHQ3_9AGAR|nr:hypothetical protein BDQ12DRAFT_730902 [Crucibulum laeve]
MPFGLTIGTERAAVLQQSIQDELTTRGFSQEPDPVMAEYITIMVINNKTAAQITTELEDLIGADYDASFTDWLFLEAAKGASGTDAPPQPQTPISETPVELGPSHEVPPHIAQDSSRRPTNAPRNGVYQQAISQALPPSSSSAQKRTASARSPSPTHPNKSRRTDLPTGPRAMFRDGSSNPNANPHPNARSLLDRVGGPTGSMRNSGPNGFQRKDDIQARIDNIVNSSPEQNMMMAGGFPGMPGMDMNAIAAANMANPLMLQEMMMNQMALMAQMASSMGIINPNTGQFGQQGFPMQGMPQDMGMFQGGIMPGQQGGGNVGGGRGRGGARGGRGSGRGRGGATPHVGHKPSELTTGIDSATSIQSAPVVAPTPTTPSSAAPAPSAAALSSGAAEAQQRPGYVLPERPQSPTLCKFGSKCTNAHCRYSHPSPVATAESGVVLSNDPCEKGKDCKDKDCIKAHVSPAVLNPQAEQSVPAPVVPTATHTPHAHGSQVPCRFGASCTRPGCTFAHPHRPTQSTQQCRFGTACTRSNCSFQHPEGRVLPSTFHRGLSTTGGMVNVQTPEAGTMSGASHNKSKTFNNGNSAAGVKEKLKELEEKKSEAEKKVKDAEAAAAANANGKKDEPKPVATAA